MAGRQDVALYRVLMNINQCGCRPYEWLGLDGDRCIRVIPRQWGQWIFAVSSLPERTEMSRGCLFPDSIPNRDVKHRLLIKLTREGSYKIGGFHCLLPKDRITWDNQYIVHIYYIHIRTVVKEVNKGIRCANL